MPTILVLALLLASIFSPLLSYAIIKRIQWDTISSILSCILFRCILRHCHLPQQFPFLKPLFFIPGFIPFNPIPNGHHRHGPPRAPIPAPPYPGASIHQPYAIPFGRGSRTNINGHVPNGPPPGGAGFRGAGRGHVAGPGQGHVANPHGTIGPARSASPYPGYGLNPLTQAPLTQNMSQGGASEFAADAMSQDFNFGDDYKSQSFYGGLEFGARDGYAAPPGGEFATQPLFSGLDAETQPASQADFGAPASQSFGMVNGDFMSQVGSPRGLCLIKRRFGRTG